jgi:hypothetical protein
LLALGKDTMTASELIAAKQTYDELKAHFRRIIALEIMDEIALPKDVALNGGGRDCDGYVRRDRQVMDVLNRHAQ